MSKCAASARVFIAGRSEWELALTAVYHNSFLQQLFQLAVSKTPERSIPEIKEAISQMQTNSYSEGSAELTRGHGPEEICRSSDEPHFQDFHLLSKENQVSLQRILFSHPEPDGKSSDVEVGGRIGILTCEPPPHYVATT